MINDEINTKENTEDTVNIQNKRAVPSYYIRVRKKRPLPTERQKKLARILIENQKRDKPLSKKEMVKQAGFAPSVYENKAHQAITAPGTKEAMKDLGFSEDVGKKKLLELLNSGTASNDQIIKICQEIFKVNGTYAPAKTDNTNKNLSVVIQQFTESTGEDITGVTVPNIQDTDFKQE